MSADDGWISILIGTGENRNADYVNRRIAQATAGEVWVAPEGTPLPAGVPRRADGWRQLQAYIDEVYLWRQREEELASSIGSAAAHLEAYRAGTILPVQRPARRTVVPYSPQWHRIQAYLLDAFRTTYGTDTGVSELTVDAVAGIGYGIDLAPQPLTLDEIITRASRPLGRGITARSR